MTALKKLRTSKGLSPSFVASKLGVTYRHFNRIENTGKFIDEKRAKILAELYNVKKSEIMEIGGIKDGRAS